MLARVTYTETDLKLMVWRNQQKVNWFIAKIQIREISLKSVAYKNRIQRKQPPYTFYENLYQLKKKQ